MRVLRISGLVLMVLSLGVGISYAQTAKECYDKGIEYGSQGRFEEVEEEFKKALKIDQFYVPAEAGLKIIEDVLEKRVKNEFAIHLFKGAAYDSKGMFDEAIAECKKAIAINPNYAEAHTNLGLAYYNKGMWDEAIAECKKAIAINPNSAEAHNNLGLAYYNKGMRDEAIAECKKAIAINPNYAKAHYNLGLAYVNKGMWDEAIAEYKKAIAINPNYAKAHNNLAVVYYEQGQYDLAIKHCDKAIELGGKVHPEFLEALKPYRK